MITLLISSFTNHSKLHHCLILLLIYDFYVVCVCARALVRVRMRAHVLVFVNWKALCVAVTVGPSELFLRMVSELTI